MKETQYKFNIWVDEFGQVVRKTKKFKDGKVGAKKYLGKLLEKIKKKYL